MGRKTIYFTEEERIAARNMRARERYNKNPDKFKKSYKKWSDKEENKLKRKEYYNNNKERIDLKNKERVERDRVRIREVKKNYVNNRKKVDPLFKFKSNIRNLICGSFKRNSKSFKKSKKTEQILGCSIEFFIDYLLLKFKDTITINDFHKYGYHLDHIIPISVANTEEEVIKLCHYTNFQPLWWEDNIQKSNKLLNL